MFPFSSSRVSFPVLELVCYKLGSLLRHGMFLMLHIITNIDLKSEIRISFSTEERKIRISKMFEVHSKNFETSSEYFRTECYPSIIVDIGLACVILLLELLSLLELSLKPFSFQQQNFSENSRILSEQNFYPHSHRPLSDSLFNTRVIFEFIKFTSLRGHKEEMWRGTEHNLIL